MKVVNPKGENMFTVLGITEERDNQITTWAWALTAILALQSKTLDSEGVNKAVGHVKILNTFEGNELYLANMYYSETFGGATADCMMGHTRTLHDVHHLVHEIEPKIGPNPTVDQVDEVVPMIQHFFKVNSLEEVVDNDTEIV